MKEKIKKLFDELNSEDFKNLPKEEKDEIALELYKKFGSFQDRMSYFYPPIKKSMEEDILFAFDCKYDIFAKYPKNWWWQNIKFEINENRIFAYLSFEDHTDGDIVKFDLDFKWKELEDPKFRDSCIAEKNEQIEYLAKEEARKRKEFEDRQTQEELKLLEKLKSKYENVK